MYMRYNPSTVLSSYAALTALNANFADVQALMERCVFRDGTSPNSMLADLDFNHFLIKNLSTPVDPNDAVRLTDLQSAMPALSGNSLATMATSTGAGMIGTIAAGTGATLRTVASKIHDVVSVKDFGVVGDGSDETLKIQAALNSAPGVLYFPQGSYGATALAVPTSTSILCTGLGTWFVPLDNTSDFFTLPGGNWLSGFQVVPGTQRTGGTIFKFTGNESKVDNFKTTKCFRVANISGTVTQIKLDNFSLRDNNNNGGSELILVDTTGGGIVVTNGLADNNNTTQPSAGVRVRQCADLTLDDLNLIHATVPLKIDPPAGKVVASIQAGKLFLDTSSTSGMVLDTSGGGSIVRCAFQVIEGSSHGSHGVSMNASAGLISGIEITHLETHLNGADGLHMSGTNFGNVTIHHHVAAGNTLGAGISVGAGTPGPDIGVAQYGNFDGIGSANKYGTFLVDAASTLKIRSGSITGNTTTNLGGFLTGLTLIGVAGCLTKNVGTGTLPSAGTSIVISHGLVGTPSSNQIKFWATSNQGATPLWLDTTTITSTQFTVKTTSAAAANITFGWEAVCLGA